MRRLPKIAAVAVALSGSAALAEPTALVLPEILLTPDAQMMRIEGVVTGTGPAEVTATLTISHNGKGGSTTTKQSRAIKFDTGSSRETVATTGINFSPESNLSVSLIVTDGDTVVAESRTNVGKTE